VRTRSALACLLIDPDEQQRVAGENPMGQPKIVPPNPRENSFQNDTDFSLVLGGPLYQIYLTTRLAQPALKLVVRRVLWISLICWLPLLLLTTFAGRLITGVTDPFLRDPEVQIRFLVALPLLVLSEVRVHRRIRTIVSQFQAHGIITGQDQPRFENLIASAMRLRNSVTVEVVLLILVSTLGYWLWRQKITINVSSWYAVNAGAGPHLTAAGFYYAFISLTIFRFIMCRWYFRLFVWYRFLWQVRALPLHLNLYHPDRAGGLGFLSGSLPAFAPVFAAQTAVLSAFIFSRILYAGQKLPAFKADIAVVLIFCILVIVFPLGFFYRQLDEAGRTAKREFSTLASRYVDDFRNKWVQGGIRPGNPLLGTPDIQSLASLADSYSVVKDIRILPMSKQNLLRLLTIIAAPLVPLMLTMFPLGEVVKRLLKLL
jgi:hypothetical protein